MRFWRILRRVLILCLVLLPFAIAIWESLFVRVTIVLLTETPLSEVRLALDGQPMAPGIEHFEASRMFVWDGLLTVRNPLIHLTWRMPDGAMRALGQELPQKYATRCIHVIRLGSDGNPLPTIDQNSLHERSPWRWLSSRCEETYG